MPTEPPQSGSESTTPDIRIAAETGFVRATYRGRLTYAYATEMIRDAARIAMKAQRKRLLFDLREADYQGYYAETISHANEGPALGIDRTFRVAFLGAKDHARMLRFIEDATVNRGYTAKVFVDEAQALAWISAAEA